MRNRMLAATGAAWMLFAATLVADTFHLNSPILVDGVFSAINGETSGYIEAELVSSVMVDIENVDPAFHGSGLLRAGHLFHVAFEGKVETVDGNGKKQKRKVARILRAGPGEQITVAFKVYDRSAATSVAVTLLYFDDSSALIGRTAPVTFYVNENHLASTVVTFTRGDLR